MTVVSEAATDNLDAAATKAKERSAIGVASGAHALHDGYTDLIYVLLPLWQAEFGIGFAALGLLRTCYSGTMAGLQIPSALLSERLGAPLVLAIGTALSGLGYLIAGASTGFTMLVVALLVGGLGSDIFPMSPALASLMLVVMPWQPVVAILGLAGLAAAAAIYWLMPRFAVEVAGAQKAEDKTAAAGPHPRSRFGFPLLLAIGMVDSGTRMGFLIFLPFILIAKGASLPTVGLALTLVFAGGAVGKLVCAFIGARIGVIGTVCLTEGLTTLGILAMLPLPLEAAMLLLPVIGIMLNGTSSVLYGSVPVLVEPEKRTRMFGIFYTGTIGSGAVSPALYGLIGDAFSVNIALCVVAGLCLLTLPLALALRPALPESAR